MSNLNTEDIANYLDKYDETPKEYRKKPITVMAYRTNKELEIETLEGTMKANIGDYIITGVKGEQYPCKPDVFHATYDLDNDTSIDDFVLDNCIEWSNLISELSRKEIQLYNLKEEYENSSEKLLKEAAKQKEETGEDIIKAKYGGNNDKTRAKYVKDSLSDKKKEIKKLEFSIDYLKRRISFLRQLVPAKTAIMEVKK